MMRYRHWLIFAVLLFMVVGFAAVSVTFNFSGTATVASDVEDFKVSFTKARLDGEDVASTVISSDGLTLKYQTGEMKLAGDKSELEFAITNNSKQYDAKIDVVCNELLVENTELKVDMEAKQIDSGEHVLGKIAVTLKKDYPGEEEQKLVTEMTCKLKVTALERTETGEEAGELEDKIYQETILNGADPVLAEGMIPVKLSEDGKVTYANINRRWYKYAKKEWANAVILKDGISTVYNVGNVIKEDDIEAYFVWIPRYKYKLWNADDQSVSSARLDQNAKLWYLKDETGADSGVTVELNKSVRTIELMFETKEVAASTSDKNGEWLTHPAFTSLDANGIWVGKFETGYDGATTTTEAESQSNDVAKIVIKPNVYSWRNCSLQKFFNNGMNYRPAAKSHLMKNMEWGAVTYLTYSRYGINKPLAINRNSTRLTGFANSSDAYNTEKGYLASTTGNIFGIYDMAGGSYEIMASVMENSNVQITKEMIEAHPEYLDLYPVAGTPKDFNKRLLGDATGELGPFFNTGNEIISYNNWYREVSTFAYVARPYFVRGGSMSGNILTFEETGSGGPGNSTTASRLVLAP